MSRMPRTPSSHGARTESAAAIDATSSAVLGGIVERNVETLTPVTPAAAAPGVRVNALATRTSAASGMGVPRPSRDGRTGDAATRASTTTMTMTSPALKAVSAVVGRGFPVVEPGKHYGRRREARTSTLAQEDVSTQTTSSHAPVGLSAHVQPEESGRQGGDAGLSSETSYHTVFSPKRTSTARAGTSAAMPTPSAAAAASTTLSAETYLAVGGGASVQVAHQWRPEDFRQLLAGHYTHPLPDTWRAWLTRSLLPSTGASAPASTDAPTATTSGAEATLIGESFFQQLFQCLRSTVRRHQEVALHVLLVHLQSDTDARGLRARCLHGPDCAAFLFFLTTLLSRAGHPIVCYRAAQCLVQLLPVELSSMSSVSASAASASGEFSQTSGEFSLALLESTAPPLDGLVAEVFGEIGAPLGDAASSEDESDPTDAQVDGRSHREARKKEDDGNQYGSTTRDHEDDADVPFSELSEMLRQGEDARVALEKMRFTTHVLMALPSLLSVHTSDTDLRDSTPYAATSHNEENEGAHTTRWKPSDRDRHRSDALIARLLLCGGAGSGSLKVATLLAQSHVFRGWLEGILADVVLGQRALADCLEVLTLAYRVAHVPAAAAALLHPPSASSAFAASSSGSSEHQKKALVGTNAVAADSFYETWTLLFTYILTTQVAPITPSRPSSTSPPIPSTTTDDEDGDAHREALSVIVGVLLLREFVRHGHRGESLAHDLLDVLLTDGLRVGGAIVFEMWLLQHDHASPSSSSSQAPHPQPLSQASAPAFKEAALAAYQLLTVAPPASSPSVSRSSWSAVFAQTASAHFLATFLTSPSQRLTALTLLGTAVDTQEQMQKVLLGEHLLTAQRLSTAFVRLTAPLVTDRTEETSLEVATAAAEASSPRTATSKRGFSPWTSFLALQAARTYADVRLISSLTAVYLGVSRPAVLGYAASLTAKFEAGCLRLRSHTEQRLQNDELATMSELIALLDTYGAAAAASTTGTCPDVQHDLSKPGVASLSTRADAHPYQHAVQVAAFFTLHGIALTKHCLDAVPPLICVVLGGTNRGAARERTRDLAEAALQPQQTAATNGEPMTTTISMKAAAWYAARLASAPSMFDASTSSSSSLPAIVALALYLEEGVIQQSPVSAAVSAASTVMAGAPRAWVLFPLSHGTTDSSAETLASVTGTAATCESEQAAAAQALLLVVWSRWMRQMLGVHQSLKYVLGYDALLCHLALWVLTHRPLVFGAGGTHGGDTVDARRSAQPSSFALSQAAASGLTDLLAQLATLLLLDATSDGGDEGRRGADRAGTASALSAPAAQVLRVSLQGTVDVESEAPLSIGAFVALVVLATQSPAPAALTMLQTILCAPLIVSDAKSAQPFNTAMPPASSEQTHSVASLSVPVVRLLQDLESWGRAASSSAAHTQTQARSATTWTLESLLSLLELAAPVLRSGGDDGESVPPEEDSLAPTWLRETMTGSADVVMSALRRWCVSMLVHGVWQRLYVAPRLYRAHATGQDRHDQAAQKTHRLDTEEPSMPSSTVSRVLSEMEKEVLRDCLEMLDWRPKEVWPYVAL